MSSTMNGNKLLDVRVGGSALTRMANDSCSKASLQVSTSSVTAMSFTFNDDLSCSMFRSGMFDPGTSISYGAWHVTANNLDLKAGPIGPVVVVKGTSKYVYKLQGQTGEKKWGKKSISSWAADQARGAGYKRILIQPGLGSREFTRAKPEKGDANPENTWDVLTSAAREAGAWLFEYGSTLVLGRPSWLERQSFNRTWSFTWSTWTNYSDDLAGLPGYSRDRARSTEKLSLRLVNQNADTIRPGDVVKMHGNIGSMRGMWLVTDVSYPMTLGDVISVTCSRAVDPAKQKAKGTATAKKKAAAAAKNNTKSAPAYSSGGNAASGVKPSAPSAVGGTYGSPWFQSWVRNKRGGKWGVEGYGVQCVGLAKQYARDLYGVWPRGNGRDWYGGSVQRQYFSQVSPRSQAQPGDIACWGPPYGKIGGTYYGHVAIVLQDNGGSLLTLSQSGTAGTGARNSTFGKSGLQGYLRPKNQIHKYSEGVR